MVFANIHPVILKHKDSTIKFLVDLLINKEIPHEFNLDKYQNNSLTFDSSNRVYFNGTYATYAEAYFLIINKQSLMSTDEWRQIFLMANSTDYSTFNLALNLAANCHILEQKLFKTIVFMLCKYQNNKHMIQKYPEFIQNLRHYVNILNIQVNGQIARSVDIDYVYSLVKFASQKKNSHVLEILSDTEIKKIFIKNYNDYLNIDFTIKKGI